VFRGELKSKTRILVTHFISLLDKVDKVILLSEKKVAAFAPYDEIKHTQEFKEFSSHVIQDQEDHVFDAENIPIEIFDHKIGSETLDLSELALE
jgi:ABC-type transporter Mla maintaining outer membrane lipid asymmetry ATPase subunit MlaF